MLKSVGFFNLCCIYTLTFRDSDVISLVVALYAIKVCTYPGSRRQRVQTFCHPSSCRNEVPAILDIRMGGTELRSLLLWSTGFSSLRSVSQSQWRPWSASSALQVRSLVCTSGVSLSLSASAEISNPRLIVIVGSFGLASNIVGLFLFHG
jgi:hypothetical protein